VAHDRLNDRVDSATATRLGGSSDWRTSVSHHEKGMAKDADKKATTKKPATKKK
jgi:hypothetical protein